MSEYKDMIVEDIMSSTSNNLLLVLPTSFGKSKIALDLMARRCSIGDRILIAVPRNVLKQNWADEFIKWGYQDYLPFVTFTTYISLGKHAGDYSMLIADECHNITERSVEALMGIHSRHNILMSATVSYDKLWTISQSFTALQTYKVSARKAIDEEVLPDPKVYLIPMRLDDTVPACQIVRNSSRGNPLHTTYSKRWEVSKIKNRKVIIQCTQKEWYNDITSRIDFLKRRVSTPSAKNRYLHTAGERLKWLSSQKTEIVRKLLKVFDSERTLTFCSSIAQTEELGKYCINSKNKDSIANLKAFNDGSINHITACAILDEGVNLVNCRVAIYASLNSSDRIITQRLGRMLRHPKPILIIPYFEGTRDAEIVHKMCKNYNPDNIKTVSESWLEYHLNNKIK